MNWHDGQDSFLKGLKRRARFLYYQFDTTGKILLQQILGDGKDPLTELARWERFFMKNLHDGQDLYDVLPNLPWTLFECEQILRKAQTRRDQTRSDQTRRDQMQ